jgi:hypothetical protein
VGFSPVLAPDALKKGSHLAGRSEVINALSRGHVGDKLPVLWREPPMALPKLQVQIGRIELARLAGTIALTYMVARAA